jgi:hypothetical protein
MRTPALLATLALVAAAPTASADSKKAARAVSVDSVVADHIAAVGGLARLKAARSMTWTSVETGDGKTTRMTATRARPNLRRYEGEGAEGAWVKAFDGSQGWYQEGSAAAQLMPAEKVAMMREKAEFDDALIGWQERGYKVALAGKEQLASGWAYRLEVTSPSGGKQVRFIDTKSHLEVRREVNFTDHAGKAVTKIVTLSDYKRVDGIMINMTTEYEYEGKKFVSRVESIRFDAPIQLAQFAPPKGAVVATEAKPAVKK